MKEPKERKHTNTHFQSSPDKEKESLGGVGGLGVGVRKRDCYSKWPFPENVHRKYL